MSAAGPLAGRSHRSPQHQGSPVGPRLMRTLAIYAAAVVALLSGQAPNPAPVLNNTCYSFITDRDVVHVASVHQYDREKKTMVTVPGSGGVSPAMNALEGDYAFAWAKNIWADMLA